MSDLTEAIETLGDRDYLTPRSLAEKGYEAWQTVVDAARRQAVLEETYDTERGLTGGVVDVQDYRNMKILVIVLDTDVTVDGRVLVIPERANPERTP